MTPFVARMERRQLDRNAGAFPKSALRGGSDGFQRITIGPGVAGRVLVGLGRLAKHVKAMTPAFRPLGCGALQCLIDGAPEHELAPKDLHCLADRGADDRLAEAAD